MSAKKFTIEVEPIGKRIALDSPVNGLKAIIDSGIGIKSVCGGKGTCGKCRIVILEDGGANAKLTATEEKILSREEIGHGIRLACEQVFDKDMVIYIPASSLTEEQKLQITGEETGMRVDPVFSKHFLKIKPPSLSDMQSDFGRLKDALLEKLAMEKSKNQAAPESLQVSLDYMVLKYMAEVLRNNSWEVTVTLRDGEIILIEGGDRTGQAHGIAIDLGTTKIAILLVDLLSGKTIAKKGIMNPQISYGEDVMSRINFAMQSEQDAKKIQSVTVEQINKTVAELAAENKISTASIIEMTVVANTAMHHIFLGLPVRQLGLSPFVALSDTPHSIKARELGINITAGGYVYMLPVIAGFIGSDHMAMILATGVDEMQGNFLGVDIGTNTEIVLKSSKGIQSVSTASGPAFEGAHIKYGMRAAPGAIERVVIDSKTCVPRIQTINDKRPIGICGSGILDAVAELLKAGIINDRGKFQPDSGCLCMDEKGKLQYMLEPGAFENNNCKKKELIAQAEKNGQDVELLTCIEGSVSINQTDIVEIQLAKSAIRTGINVLLESAGLDFKDIDRIIIAGAFGSYIDPKNVVNIGMFPAVSLKKIVQVGNAASVGAKMVLVSSVLRKKAEDISSRARYLELTIHPTFTDNFVRSTLFPGPDEII
ncbi:MAG: Na(+)-translocating NADH-quinone reductase subunit F [Actinobacteria bacterium ADurb.Bin346]|nr:MAG: Na(+)-translocating NADH-quinone reductase subunit F [Actinobacteria bacterium ADurb.Bin346]